MAARIARHDWAANPLGPLDTWPGYLRHSVALMLRSSVPMVMLWGDDGIMIYNDAYSVFAGGRHPQLLGAPVRTGWPEVAAFNDNVMKVGLSGATLGYQDQELTLLRSGQAEQVWMNLDYSPLIDDEGRAVGVLAIVIETTAKVRAERHVRSERERLGRMFEQAPGFMALLSGPKHVFEFVNPAYQQLIGHRDVIGMEAREALPEVEGQGYFELVDEVFASGRPVIGSAQQVSLQRAPGAELEQRHVDFVFQPLRDERDQVVGIFIQGTDVTERMQAEERLRASEAQFRAFAEAVPNQVWAADPDGQVYWVNGRACEQIGVPAEELLGRDWLRFIHPDDVAVARERWSAAAHARTTYETESRIRTRDGGWRWHLTRAMPIQDASGTVLRWVGTNTDIEDQKSAARALARLNQNLEEQVAQRTTERDRIWNLSTDVMAVMDREGMLVSANPAWERVLGWTDADLFARPWFDWLHPDDRSAARAALRELGTTQAGFRLENRWRRRDGSYCILSWTGAADGTHIHAVGRDVTADREAADKLRASQAALQQAQKMESVGKLTGGVAHDFNNLLQVIGGNLQLLGKLVSGSAQAERHVHNALAGVSRGAKLASQLLAFARRQPLEPRVVNIGRFVSGMEDMLRRTLGESVELETVVSGGLWNTFIDPVQVENALLNLAINARDAMDGVGKLTVEVGNSSLDDAYARAHEDVAPGQYVMLAVSDTGCGMPPEVQAKAFEPFFSTKPEGKGTGLGLSMVYGFVKQSGGHVKIYSEPGQGTTIKLYLPRSLEAEAVVDVIDTKPVPGGNETILVAEDDDEVRAVVVEMLTSLGYRVLKARDASSALAIIESGAPIDLLFTDVVMPGPLRSPELARRARELLPQLAVLFTSGYTENAIVHGGRLDPGVELIGKPYTQEALGRKVRHVLANQKQRVSAAQAPQVRPLRTLQVASQKVILVVEDDESIRTTTAELVRGLGHDVREAARASEALEILRSCAVDVLMTDMHLAEDTGAHLAQQATALRPGIQVVLATGDPQAPVPRNGVLLQKPYDSNGISRVLLQLSAAARG